MDNREPVIQNMLEEIYYRYPIRSFGEAENLFYEALKDENVQEKIYDKVHELILENR
jgi:hypothetical protein